MKDQLIFDTTDANTIADSDSVGAFVRSDDGTLITHTTVGSEEHLNVYAALAAGNGTAITETGGALDVNIASGTVTITPEGVHAEDDAHVSGDEGEFALSIRMDDVDGANSALLAGTEGDYQGTFTNAKGEMHVRDNDSVDLLTTIDADTSAIALDTAAMVVDLAAIEVELLDQGTTLDSILADTTTIASDTTSIDGTLTGLSKAEDAAHSSGDQGIMGLAVRNDTLGSLVDTDGDYAPLQVDASGALYTNISNTIDVNDAALADTAIANAVNTLASANTAEDVVASPLANRKYLYIYNNDNRKMYIGASGVSAANGFPVSPGSYVELRAGASVDIEWVSEKVSHDIRTLELS